MAPYKYIRWCFLFACLSFSHQSFANKLSEDDKLKAAFLFNFTQYIEWLDQDFANSPEPINICLSNNGEFSAFLEDLVKGRKVGKLKKTLKVSNFQLIQEDTLCHLSYITNESDAEITNNNTLLKVGDSPETAKLGVAIHFYERQQKVRFAVYLSRLESQGVKLSSEFLKLAKIIKEE